MATPDDVMAEMTSRYAVTLYEGGPGQRVSTDMHDKVSTFSWDFLRWRDAGDVGKPGRTKQVFTMFEAMFRVLHEVTLWLPRRKLNQLTHKAGNGEDTVLGHAVDAASYGDINYRILARLAQKMGVDISDIQ